jgi:acetyl-CoA acyltransferase
MNQAVIVDAVRTPMGRSKNGVFRNVRAENLSGHLIRTLLDRYPSVDPASIDDIMWGCVQQTLEQGYNVARMASILAGVPFEVPAQTINRLCGSSMSAIHTATQAIQSGNGEVFICGGVEHMGHISMTHGADINPALSKHIAKAAGMMGLTAELLARSFGVSREAQDEFAMVSHQRADEAAQGGTWGDELVATPGHNADGFAQLIDQDEVIRPDTSMETLGKLRPSFDPRGSVTAGNSSAISDGASAVLLMSEAKAAALNLQPIARVIGMGVAGCDPSVMGRGPVPATKKALEKAGLTLDQMDYIELNEAFAAQSLAVIQEMELTDRMDRINVRGGAIALGHPLGCSGARITGAVAKILQDEGGKYGLATMCIGLGQGIATVIERV